MSTPEEREDLLISRILNSKRMKNLIATAGTLSDENQVLLTSVLNLHGDLRSITSEIKQLEIENGQLTAKRQRQKLEWNKMNKNMKTLNNRVKELTESIQQNECEIDNDSDQYNKKLMELANQYRQSAKVYDEEYMKRETEKSKKILSDLQAEEKALQAELADLTNELNGLEACVPENILEIMSEKALEEI